MAIFRSWRSFGMKAMEKETVMSMSKEIKGEHIIIGNSLFCG
jgi:hypothetical protein